MKTQNILIVAIIALSGIKSNAQVGDTVIGLNSNRSYSGSTIDHVDILNRGLTVKVPLFSIPQKGRPALSASIVWNSNRFRYNIAYDTYYQSYIQYYDLSDTSAPFGASVVFDQQMVIGAAAHSSSFPVCYPTEPPIDDGTPCENYATTEQTYYTLRDSTGASHEFLPDASDPSIGRSIDGSGLQ